MDLFSHMFQSIVKEINIKQTHGFSEAIEMGTLKLSNWKGIIFTVELGKTEEVTWEQKTKLFMVLTT